MKIFAGLGSRKTPPEILAKMTQIAEHLAQNGWTLRSGGADGADIAFEAGCDKAGGKKEIYLPWEKFNENSRILLNRESDICWLTDNAFLIASTIHGGWHNLSYGAKKLHARNVYQILGIDLNAPADLVICWTPNGKEIGGTATALKLATQYKIRIINLATEEFDFIQFS